MQSNRAFPTPEAIPEFTSTGVCNTCGTGKRNSYSLLYYKEDNLSDAYSRDLFPYKVAAELYQAQKDLKVNLVEGSGLDFNLSLC
ncbi:MAG: hypothetical protein MR017_00865 [Paraprevotella sp.]|nr:hypothetical protein [Paraprevotella sp.]